MKPVDFIAKLNDAAKICQDIDGIPYAFTVAQAALESAWGESQLAKQGNNLFGVKADKSWTGATLELPTKEFLRGKWVTVTAKWRKYETIQDCLCDHAKFFKENPRYARALPHALDGIRFAFEVALAGYATDPDYAKKLISIINANDLLRYEVWT